MNVKSLLIEVVVTFVLAFVIAAMVTFLWSWLRDGITAVNWQTTFTMAVILAIIVPLTNRFKK